MKSHGIYADSASDDLPTTGRSVWRWSAILLVLLSVTAAYSNSLSAPFVFDDGLRIVDDPAIRTVWPPWIAMSQSNRPFANYTFALNYWADGLNPRGYHLTNLVIHLLAVLCLYGIVRRTCWQVGAPYRDYSEALGLIAALLWGLHPLQTESVTYVVQRLESLMGLAYLVTLYCLLRGATASAAVARIWYGLSIFACAFGMGCKEVMVTAPVIMLWYDRVYLSRSWGELWSTRGSYYFALAATWCVLAWSMLHFHGDYSNGALLVVPGVDSFRYLISQTVAITHYLWLSIWPASLCIHYDAAFPKSLVEVWPQALFISLLFAFALVSAFRHPKLGFLGVWLFVVLSPTSSIVPIQDMIFEHRMYLPLAALCVLVAIAWFGLFLRLEWLVARGQLGLLLPIAPLLVALSMATYQRNQVYGSDIALWQDTVNKAPLNAKAWSSLGTAFADTKDLSKARACFARSVELDPTRAKTVASLGGMLLEAQEYEPAEKYLLAALAIDPRNELALMNLGNLRLEQGRFSEAIDHFQQVLPFAEHPNEIRLSLAACMLRIGMFEEAMAHCQKVIDQEANPVEALVNMACALGGLGRTQEAISQCEAALAIDPACANAYATLAILVQASDPEQAQVYLDRALALEPRSPEFHYAMGELLFAKNASQAIPHYRAVLEQRPDDVAAQFKLAVSLDLTGQPEAALPYMENVVRLLPGSPEAIDCLHQLRRKIGTGSGERSKGAGQPR